MMSTDDCTVQLPSSRAYLGMYLKKTKSGLY